MEKLEKLKDEMTRKLEDYVVCEFSSVVYEKLEKLGYKVSGDVSPEQAFKLEDLCYDVVLQVIENLMDEDQED